MQALQRLRDYLLPGSLEYAARNSAFYAAHLGDTWRAVKSVRDLVHVPTLSKATALTNQEAMRCGDAPLDFGAVSSGTTRIGKDLLSVQHCPAEDDALGEYLDMLAADGPRQPDPLVLHILSPSHGIPRAPPPENTVRIAWAYARHICDMIEQALRATYGGRRISVMRVSIQVLRELTLHFLETGVDPAQFAVRQIGTNASLVTRRWRHLVEERWRARIFDNYSLSEIVTPATECQTCSWYHFDIPPMVPEVVDPCSGEQLEAGIGELLITTLYPYTQRQPFVRYHTGDLVELGPPCAAAADLSLRFRGRVQQSVFDPGPRTRYLLFSSEVEDLIDDYPEVARHRHPFEVVQALPSERVGQPKFTLDRKDDEVHVGVGVLFDPRLFATHATALAGELRAHLLERAPELAAAVQRGERRLTVRPIMAWPEDPYPWVVKFLM